MKGPSWYPNFQEEKVFRGQTILGAEGGLGVDKRKGEESIGWGRKSDSTGDALQLASKNDLGMRKGGPGASDASLSCRKYSP